MIIAITGGIGSGKSTISMALIGMGYKVYNSDKRASELINSSEKVISALKNSFGNDIYTTSGTLDKVKMAATVFSDKKRLKELNSIVHPAVFEDFKEWSSSSSDKLLFVESAILFESGFDKMCDKIVTISAPTELKIKRVMKRDSATRPQVEARIKSQMSDSQRESLSDFTIICDDKHSLIQQILQIIDLL